MHSSPLRVSHLGPVEPEVWVLVDEGEAAAAVRETVLEACVVGFHWTHADCPFTHAGCKILLHEHVYLCVYV